MQGHLTFLLHANNKGTDQPAPPRSLISAFVIRYLESIVITLTQSQFFNIQAKRRSFLFAREVYNYIASHIRVNNSTLIAYTFNDLLVDKSLHRLA